MKKIRNMYLLLFLFVLLIFLASCSSNNLNDVEEGTYFGTIDEINSSYIKYDNDKIYYSIYGDYFAVFSKVDDEVKTHDNIKSHIINFEYDKEATSKLENAYSTDDDKQGFKYFKAIFVYNSEEDQTSPSLIFIQTDDKNIDLKNSKIASGSAEKITTSKFPEIIFNADSKKKDEIQAEISSNQTIDKEVNIKRKKESIYRLDGIVSKYTYESSLVKKAIKEVGKISKNSIENNYNVKENEMGELYIEVYSSEKENEIIESYIFDPYTKKIANTIGYFQNDTETVSKVIKEAISVVEDQTSYSNMYPYILSGYVTDEGTISVEIGISDENKSGEVIIKDQAIYDPITQSLKEFPKNDPMAINGGLNEKALIEEAVNSIEKRTGYIEGNPYIYDAYSAEDGVIVVEVRAEGDGNSGTMSLVDRFQYFPQNSEIYIYDSVNGNYNLY